MWRMYLITAFRTMKRYKLHTAIIVLSLSLGLSAALLSLSYISGELSWESVHSKADRIHRVSVIFQNGPSAMHLAGAMAPLAPALVEDFPEVEKATRLCILYNAWVDAGDEPVEARKAFYAENSFFELFDVGFIQGDPNQALKEPNTAVLSGSMAEKLFGESQRAIGQTITVEKQDYRVVAITEDLPVNTHLRFDVLLAMSNFFAKHPGTVDAWTSAGSYMIFALLKPGASMKDVMAKLPAYYQEKTNEWAAKTFQLRSQSLRGIHFATEIMADFGPKGNITYIRLFSAITVLLLAIACINTVNLTTAMFSRRVREIGIRKTFGAGKREIIQQILVETAILTALASLIAWAVFSWFNPMLARYLSYDYNLDAIISPWYYLSLIPGFILIVFLTGLHPALTAARRDVIPSLGGGVVNGRKRGLLQKSLITIQFAISTILIASTMIILMQLRFINHSDLGFDKENTYRIPLMQEKFRNQADVLKEELLDIPGVQTVSTAFLVPGSRSSETKTVGLPGTGTEDRISISFNAVGPDYDRALGLTMVEGRFLQEGPGHQREVVLNQEAVRVLGLKKPVGAAVIIPDENREEVEATVVGVVKDFHVKSLRDPIEPMILYQNPTMNYMMIVRVNPESVPGVLEKIDRTWESLFPDEKIERNSLTSQWARTYDLEEKVFTLAMIFSLLIIGVSCSGLFGLTAFAVAIRTREIGIRKTIGATTSGLAMSMTLESSRWALLSGLIAIPVAWYIMRTWLQNFAYHIQMPFWPFFVSTAVVFLLASLTAAILTWRAASQKPADALRYE